MKKIVTFRIALLILILLAISLIVACGSQTLNSESGDSVKSISQPLQIYSELENYVTMVVTNISATSVTITIQNNTSLYLITGSSYMLEVYDNGLWYFGLEYFIPGGIRRVFTLEGIIISPYGSFDMTKSLRGYLPLELGLYRIRKDVMIDPWQQTDEVVYGSPRRNHLDTLHEMVAEFKWEWELITYDDN